MVVLEKLVVNHSLFQVLQVLIEDYKLYYPKEMILNIENPQTKGSIINLLNELN